MPWSPRSRVGSWKRSLRPPRQLPTLLQYQAAIRNAVARGCTLRVVISDPEGPLMTQPLLIERLCPSIRQEGDIVDVLRTCTRHQQHAAESGLPEENVQARVYGELPSMNMLMVDGWIRVIPYLPLVDAAECPVFEYHSHHHNPSQIVSKYLLSMDRLWHDARPIDLSNTIRNASR